MNFTITCPSCERPLRVPEDLLGQTVKCPSCSATFAVPDSIEEKPSRPTAPPPEDEYEEEASYYDEDYDEQPRRRAGREKPGKVQAISVLILVGGILSCVWCAGCTLLSGLGCCLWPGLYYGWVFGIMAIIKGAKLLGDKAYREAPPYGIANMMIINIINGDLPNLVMGILVLVFLSDEEVKRYFRR